MSVKSIPNQYCGTIPYLNVIDGEDAIEFYKKAFGAHEVIRIMRKNGKLGHAELKIAEAVILLRDEIPEMNFLSPSSIGGTPINILIYVNDLDAFIKQAASSGARVIRPIEKQFHGDMMAVLEDPFGFSWLFASRIEDIPHNEMQQRATDWGI